MASILQTNSKCDRERILLINLSFIGDVISSMVVAQSAARRFREIDFLVKPEMISLLADEPGIRPIASLDRNACYDIVIDLTSSKASRKMIRQQKSGVKIGFYRSFWHRARMSFWYTILIHRPSPHHIVRCYYPLVDRLGWPGERLPEMHAPDIKLENRIFIRDATPPNGKLIGVHVGAGIPLRVIAPKMMRAMFDHLKHKNTRVLLLGNEHELAMQYVRDYPRIAVFKPFELDELKSVFRHLDLFIGPDSGLMHLAAAMHVPALGIYGPNLSSISGPLASEAEFVETDFPCRPCDQTKACPHGRKCMESVPMDPILRKIDRMLDRPRSDSPASATRYMNACNQRLGEGDHNELNQR